MPSRAKAVAVAKDVLKQLRLRKLNMHHGSYMTKFSALPVRNLTAILQKRPDADLQEVVDCLAPKCSVCAKGALILSKARLLDNVPLKLVCKIDYTGKVNLGCGDPSENLLDCFSQKQLDLIETAFEKSDEFEGVNSESAVGHALSFGEQYDDPAKLMRAIMKNVIENNGVFRPKRKAAQAR